MDYTFLGKITCTASSIILDGQKASQDKFLCQIEKRTCSRVTVY